MSWYKYNGRILKEGGKIAIAEACCCTCCDQLPDNLTAVFTNGCGAHHFYFRANDPSTGLPWGLCEEIVYCDFPNRTIQMAVDKCWLSYSGSGKEVEFLCGQSPPGQGAGGLGLCNSWRTGWLKLICGQCPPELGYPAERQLFIHAYDFCFNLETIATCLFPTHPCGSIIDLCAAAVPQHKISFQWDYGWPCPGCMTGEEFCDCNTLEITW